ncbi:MAG: hypothetical protein OZ935_06230 [Pseudomonadota bacterium]|nr:hypothetical protein [Pseudomonadota bacterium]
MLHPNQFDVNEAWIVFQLNDAPIRTEQDGDFNFLALMDAASCFILTSAPVATTQVEPTRLEAKRLLTEAHAHKKRWPDTLFVPSGLAAQLVVAEAERLGMDVVRVAEEQLLPFIGEAQEGFSERFGGRAAG